jgi:hypothetical protein
MMVLISIIPALLARRMWRRFDFHTMIESKKNEKCSVM